MKQIYNITVILLLAVLPNQLFAQQLVIMANNVSGCAPLPVQFSTNLTGAKSYHWDMGNGNTSTLPTPVNVFLNEGKYTVKLVVNKEDGTMDSVSYSNFVTVNPNAVSDFVVLGNAACENENTFSFLNKSLHMTSCLWDFGDGNTSTEINPIHTYAYKGDYTVKLITYNNGECADIKTVSNAVQITSKPKASFEANTVKYCQPGESVQFTATTAGAVNWFWDFGDGKESTLENPQHVYDSVGTYTVSLVVINGFKCNDTIIKKNYIQVFEPKVPQLLVSSSNGCEQELITFSTTITDFKKIFWSFGDGGNSMEASPKHEYKNAGAYSVALTVTDGNECTYSASAINLVNIQTNAVAEFSNDKNSGCAPLEVSFNNVSKGADLYLWDFGDGVTSIEKNPIHTYTKNGVYTVVLKAFTKSGCVATHTKTNAITIAPPVAGFSSGQTAGCTPLTVQFQNNSSGASSYLWDFGDNQTSIESNPSNTYTSLGEYTVRLIAFNDQGCADTIVKNGFVKVDGNDVNYTSPAVTNGCAPFSADLDLHVPGAVSWKWNFGDSTTSDIANPGHTFEKAGLYKVSLTVMLNNNCVKHYPEVKSFNIQGGIPEFNFEQTGCPNGQVSFKDTTFGKPVSWFWDFGDGITSTEQNPQHKYSKLGFYSILFSVKTESGCEGKIIQSNILKVENCKTDSSKKEDAATLIGGGPMNTLSNPEALQAAVDTVKPIGGCIPLPVAFHNIFPKTTSWLWSFGDGETSTMQHPFHTYQKNGTFDVKLVAKDAAGVTDSIVFKSFIRASGGSTKFSFIQNSSCDSTVLVFSDSSKNISSWSWNFGDGFVSEEQSPVHTYTTFNKNYNIKLKTVSQDGCSGEYAANFLNKKDEPEISSNKRNACENQPINFYCSTMDAKSYLWDFGDGETSTKRTPTHTYKKEGSFTVTLNILSSNGCERFLTLPYPIRVNIPVADFELTTQNGCNSVTVNVLNKSQGVGLPLESNCKWDFSDGSASEWAESAVHTFTKIGKQFVKLTVTNEMCTSIEQKTVNVRASVVADFIEKQSTKCFPVTVTYTDRSKNAASWLWDFGDGNTSTLKNPQHIFTKMPEKDVVLVVTDSGGCKDEKIRSKIKLFNTDFKASVSEGCAPLTVKFTDRSEDADKWFWDFGDGKKSTARNPEHIYTDKGVYSVTLVSQMKDGCSDTMLFNSIIVDKPKADFSSTAPSGCSPTVVQFTDNSVDAVSWLWDFGDGSQSVNQNPSHIYNIPGLYTIKLIVKNQLNCTDTMVKVNYIKVPGVIAKFSLRSDSICNNSPLSFIDSSINVATWVWNFGDGNVSGLKNPSHIYQNTGKYTISLIVKDSSGCRASYHYPGEVMVNPAPVARFTVSDSIFCAPYSVNFTNYSENAAKCIWSFGDGDTTSVYSPTHIYIAKGQYGVSLVTINKYGCSDTSSVIQLKSESKLHADFSADNVIGCSELTVRFKDSVTNNANCKYLWSVGDGRVCDKKDPTISYTNPGLYSVELIVKNDKGCSDTIFKPYYIKVFGKTSPPIANILCATVLSDTSAYLIWEPVKAENFLNYKVFRQNITTGEFELVSDINDINQTSFTDVGLNTLRNSYCYKIQTVDNCGNAVGLNELKEHCTINITASANYNFTHLVKWNSYVGAQVESYSVYRMETDNNAAVKIAEVPANVLSVVDSGVYCPMKYVYKVRANKLNGKAISSMSDSSAIKLDAKKRYSVGVNIIRSTVINNKSVLTEWETPSGLSSIISHFVIYKSLDNKTYNYFDTVSAFANQYIDNNVDVNTQNYYYKIEARDNCGESIQAGLKGSSILLQVFAEADKVQLSWTDYHEWNPGVDYYIIEKKDKYGNWEKVKQVGPEQLNTILEN